MLRLKLNRVSKRGHWCLAGACFSLIPIWVSNYIHYKEWGDIRYPFPNFKGAIIEVWEWIRFHPTLYGACDYLSMLGLKLIHVGIKGPGIIADKHLSSQVIELHFTISPPFRPSWQKWQAQHTWTVIFNSSLHNKQWSTYTKPPWSSKKVLPSGIFNVL